MRLILEKDDLVKILSRHFNETFDPRKVQVRGDPFEVELTQIPLADVKPAEALVVSGTAREPATRVLGRKEGFEGPVEVSDPPAVPENAGIVSLRAERNVSTEVPPYTSEETLDGPATRAPEVGDGGEKGEQEQEGGSA